MDTTDERLQHLILRRKDELGDSWPSMAKRGGFPTHTTLYYCATREHTEPPRRLTLERIARAIDVPLPEVCAAAARSARLI